MQIFNNKSELAKYLQCSRPTIETKLRKWEVKQISIGKSKRFVIVKEFIIYLLS